MPGLIHIHLDERSDVVLGIWGIRNFPHGAFQPGLAPSVVIRGAGVWKVDDDEIGELIKETAWLSEEALDHLAEAWCVGVDSEAQSHVEAFIDNPFKS